MPRKVISGYTGTRKPPKLGSLPNLILWALKLDGPITQPPVNDELFGRIDSRGGWDVTQKQVTDSVSYLQGTGVLESTYTDTGRRTSLRLIDDSNMGSNPFGDTDNAALFDVPSATDSHLARNEPRRVGRPKGRLDTAPRRSMQRKKKSSFADLHALSISERLAIIKELSDSVNEDIIAFREGIASGL